MVVTLEHAKHEIIEDWRTVLRLVGNKAAAIDEEEAEEDLQETELVHFDPSTGEIVDEADDGIISLQLAECEEDEHDRKFYVKKCVACGEKKAPSRSHSQLFMQEMKPLLQWQPKLY